MKIESINILIVMEIKMNKMRIKYRTYLFRCLCNSIEYKIEIRSMTFMEYLNYHF